MGTPLRDVHREPVKVARESAVADGSRLEERRLVNQATSVPASLALRQSLAIVQKQWPGRTMSAGIEQQNPHRLLSTICAKA
jgi:hypothetical protein